MNEETPQERRYREKCELTADGWRKLAEFKPAFFVPKPRSKKRSATRLKWRQTLHMKDAIVQIPTDNSKAPKGFLGALERLLWVMRVKPLKQILQCERRYERLVKTWYNLRLSEGHLPKYFGKWV